ncbi:tetratricopeptide repeat protein [Candidatus Sumerlaeota bacterium]|nr:tetratricopeptide repeat protein [Candidatus Sumerlaeota bacterium]
MFLISLAASVPGRSTLEEIRVYDNLTDLRVVFDMDRLALMEIDSDLPAGELTVLLRNTDVAENLAIEGERAGDLIEVLEPGASTSDPLTVRIHVGQPLEDANHFVLRQLSDLVINLERQSPLLPPLTTETADAPATAETVSALATAETADAPLTAQTSVAPVTEEIAAVPDEVQVLPPPVDDQGISSQEEADIPWEANLPPEVLPDPEFNLPDELTSVGIQDRTQSIVGELSALNVPVPQAVLQYTPDDLPVVSPAATGYRALTSDYAWTPAELEDLPPPVGERYHSAMASGGRIRAVNALHAAIADDPQGEAVEQMVFLIAEQHFWIARENAVGAEDDDPPDWFRAINDFRYALRHWPRSRWAPLAWLRICDAYRRMGWAMEVLATLESFQRAGTDYSVGAILHMRSEVLHELGREDERIAVLGQLLDVDPHGPFTAIACLDLGQLLHERGDDIAAYNVFRRAWELDEDQTKSDPDVLTNIIETSITNQDLDWATQLIEHIFRSFPARPENAEVASLLAAVHRARGETEQALYVYRGMLSFYGENWLTAEAIIRLADQAREDEANGITRPEVREHAYLDPEWGYTRVIHRFPDVEIAQVAHLRLGQLFIDEGEPERAIIHLNDMLIDWPESEVRPLAVEMMDSALEEALELHLGKGDRVGAVALMRMSEDLVVELQPSAPLRWRLAQELADLGLWSQSANLAMGLLDEWGGQTASDLPWEEILITGLEALRHVGRSQEALETLTELEGAVESASHRATVAHIRAGLLHSLGRWDEALRAAEQALSIGGSEEQRLTAMFLRADCTKRTLGPEMALPLCVEALVAFQRGGGESLTAAVPYEIVFQLADCLYQTGNWGRAQRVYEELVELYPDADERAIFDYRIAQCMAQRGEIEQARGRLEMLMAAHPSTVWETMGGQSLRDFDWMEEYPEIFSDGGVLQ